MTLDLSALSPFARRLFLRLVAVFERAGLKRVEIVRGAKGRFVKLDVEDKL